MIKTCPNCKNSFNTRDSRQQTCSKTCADVTRSTSQLDRKTAGLGTNPLVVYTHTPRAELPAPETLPAAYVKRVHDLWVSLIEDGPTRIA